jgi:DNA-binding response OmpR family regulator
MAHILIIDDDPQILKLITSYLKKDGHEVTTAKDGKQGIKQLTSQQFDVVITDIVMPEKDGLEVLMWLRSQKVRPRVIAISGGSAFMDQTNILQTCKMFSADIVLPKPVDFETLTSSVRNVLENVE